MTKQDWLAFWQRSGMDYLYLGYLNIMTSECFGEYITFLFQVLSEAAALNLTGLLGDDAVPGILEHMGNVLTAFFVYTMVNLEDSPYTAAIASSCIYSSLSNMVMDIYGQGGLRSPCIRMRDENGTLTEMLQDADQIDSYAKKGFVFDSFEGYSDELCISTGPGAGSLAEKLQEEYPAFRNHMLVPLFQFFHPERNDCICTTSLSDTEELTRQGYVFEEFLGYIIAPDTADGAYMDAPVFSLELAGTDHLYTRSREEYDTAQRSLAYVPGKLLGYEPECSELVFEEDGRVYRAKPCLVLRYWSEKNTCHLYTCSEESDREGFVKDGGCFYTLIFT